MAIQRTYTSGNWLIKEGQEKEFIRRWKEFAQWTVKNVPGSGDYYLIAESKNSRHFVSFGSWENQEVVNRWRQLPEFKDFLGKCKQLCEDFHAGDYILKISSKKE